MKKMYYLVLLLLFINFSCLSQENIIEIKGNWYNFEPINYNKLSYVETYFDGNLYYFYVEESGLKIGVRYFIKNNKICLIINKETQNEYIDINLSKGILEIKSKETTIRLKKIIETDFTLKKYINKEITENEYIVNGYWKRKSIWKKNGGSVVNKVID